MRYLFIFLSAFTFAQQSQSVDFKTIDASIGINPIKRNVIGKVTYTFEVKNATDTIKIDAVRMAFSNVRINEAVVPYKSNNKNLFLYKGFKVGTNVLKIDYEAIPSQGMYFVNWEDISNLKKFEDMQGQVWTLGQGKENSHWIPSFDDKNEKVIFNLDISFQKSFEVVSNGTLIDKNEKGDYINWKYNMAEPMSSCQLMLAIGHFNKKEIVSSSGIPMEFYYEKDDSKRVEPTYRYSKRLFEFFEKELEVPYRWANYKEVPVKNFIYSGKGNTMVTLFSRTYMVDSIGFVDRNYVNLNANLIVRQWLDDFVTASDEKDKMLQEQFAAYYALLAEKDIFGENYFYNELLQIYSKLNSGTVDETNSDYMLQKGILALHYIRDTVGRARFNATVKHFLVQSNWLNCTFDEFLKELSINSSFNNAFFKKKWLESTVLPHQEIETMLEKNTFAKQYFQLKKEPLSITEDKAKILEIFKDTLVYYPIKTELVYQSVSVPNDKKEYLLSAALKTKDIKIRQSVAFIVKSIPEGLKPEYETLLDDKSYKTQQYALVNLWTQFPENQYKYLKLSAEWEGFLDKNLRIEHLFLAYLTIKNQDSKFKIYRELLEYTQNNFDTDVRQNAIEKLLLLDMNTEAVFLGLANGTCSYQKSFNKFSKDTIRRLLKDYNNKVIFIKIRGELGIRERTQLQMLLSER